MGLFDSVFSLVSDVVTVVAAPVEMVVDVAGAVVKPIAEEAKELVKDVKSI